MVDSTIKHAFYLARTCTDFSVTIRAGQFSETEDLFCVKHVYSGDVTYNFYMQLEDVVFAYLHAVGEEYAVCVEVNPQSINLVIWFV